jgi:predicted small metal-binding protein
MRRNRYWTAQALMGPSPAAVGHSRPTEITVRRPAMKEFYCGAIIHGCETRIAASNEEDLIRSIDTHARVDHGMIELPESLLEQVRRDSGRGDLHD